MGSFISFWSNLGNEDCFSNLGYFRESPEKSLEFFLQKGIPVLKYQKLIFPRNKKDFGSMIYDSDGVKPNRSLEKIDASTFPKGNVDINDDMVYLINDSRAAKYLECPIANYLNNKGLENNSYVKEVFSQIKKYYKQLNFAFTGEMVDEETSRKDLVKFIKHGYEQKFPEMPVNEY